MFKKCFLLVFFLSSFVHANCKFEEFGQYNCVEYKDSNYKDLEILLMLSSIDDFSPDLGVLISKRYKNGTSSSTFRVLKGKALSTDLEKKFNDITQAAVSAAMDSGEDKSSEFSYAYSVSCDDPKSLTLKTDYIMVRASGSGHDVEKFYGVQERVFHLTGNQFTFSRKVILQKVMDDQTLSQPSEEIVYKGTCLKAL